MRKFKCVKGYKSGEWLTEGKIYTVYNNNFKFDDGYTDTSWSLHNPAFNGDRMSDYLVEIKDEKDEVKMNKFKVGDVVIIIKNVNGHCFKVGDIVEIYEVTNYNGRCRRIGENQTLGNLVWFWEMELIKEKKEGFNTKTLTITTSDTTTTITDGTHTTSINRYYTDKHNERNAVSIVIDKYYDELAEIDRVSKLPKVGDKVKVINNGKTALIHKSYLISNDVSLEFAIKWNMKYTPVNGNKYTVSKIVDDNAFIEDENYAFVINVEGLEVIK